MVEHEMLHVLELPHSWTPPIDAGVDHSFGANTPSAEYKDCWDMMSYAGCALSFPRAGGGQQGPASMRRTWSGSAGSIRAACMRRDRRRCSRP